MTLQGICFTPPGTVVLFRLCSRSAVLPPARLQRAHTILHSFFAFLLKKEREQKQRRARRNAVPATLHALLAAAVRTERISSTGRPTKRETPTQLMRP